MSSNKFFAVFGKVILVLIVLGIIGYGGYYFGTRNNQSAPQNQVYNQPTAIPTNAAPTEIPTAVPTIDESSALKTAIKSALITEHGNDAASLNITVAKIEGDYASGDASAQGGGGMWFAAKVNGVWKLVWDGNGSIQCSSLIPYPNFPADIIPQCWKDSDQSVVKR